MDEKKNLDLTSEVISEIDRDDSSSEETENENENETETPGNAIDDIKITKEFQENVIKFVKLDDLIRKKKQEVSELSDQKKPCEEFILKYLDNVNENVIEITDGKLRKNKSETKAALKQDVIKNAINEKIADPKIVEEILNLMEMKRPLNTHVNLKRTAKRNKKQKTKNNLKG